MRPDSEGAGVSAGRLTATGEGMAASASASDALPRAARFATGLPSALSSLRENSESAARGRAMENEVSAGNVSAAHRP